MKRVFESILCVALIAVLVAAAGTAIAGCGGSDEQAKADLNTALVEFETAVAALQQLSATSTVADLKKGNEDLKAPYEKVVAAAKKVSGADVATFETAWNDVQAAVAAIPDDASIVTAGLQLMPKIQPLTQAEAALKALVAPAE